MKNLSKSAIFAATLATFGWNGPVWSAAPAQWSKIPTKSVTLFYPGQSTYNWLRSPKHKRGAYRKVKAGEACLSCHEGEEKDIGAVIVTGEKLEPTPIPGKHPTVDVKVQAAYDTDNVYFRFQWRTQMRRPGQMHDYIKYDGGKWAFYGGPRSSAKVRSGAEPPLYEDRLSIMVDDGTVPLFAEQGCWLSCHNGMRDQPGAPSAEQVKSHPYLGHKLKKHDVRKYIPSSRTDDDASWDKTRSADEIARLQAKGVFLDLMQWRAARSNPVGMADDGYVLGYRLFDAGKKPFSWNVDKKTMTPKYMFDQSKVGMKSLSVDDIGNPSKPYAMIREQNALAYDPNAGWKDGDVLPGRLLTRTGTKGSAADNKNVNGTWKDGVWTLVWTRPLNTGHTQDDKVFEDGKVYNIGLAVHDDNVTTRFHFVSFPLTLGIGASADIEAVRVP